MPEKVVQLEEPQQLERLYELYQALEEKKLWRAKHRWICDRAQCDGEPHEGWTWCKHDKHEPSCRHARTDQRMPEGEWSIWLYMAGRGAGKTRAGAEALFDRILSGQATRIALIGRTPKDVRDTMIDGDSGIMAVARARGFTTGPNSEVWHIPSQSRIIFNLLGHRAVATTYASTVPGALRGPNFDFAWADEAAIWMDAHKGTKSDTTWSNLRLALRIGNETAKMIVTTTPKRVRLVREMVELRGVEVRTVATMVNEKNLAPEFLSILHDAYRGTALERQELGGELLTDVEGALWSVDQLTATQDLAIDPATLPMIVIGVDPAGSKAGEGDTTGIIVAGLSKDKHVYVLDDLSGRWAPAQWAEKIIQAANDWKVDRIYAEGNFGGEMVRELLRQAGAQVPVNIVHASRGKRPRAEPVAALSGDPARPESWGKSRLHVPGTFLDLVDELASWTPDVKESPGRLDALVWAVNGLGVLGNDPVGSWLAYAADRLASRDDSGGA